MGTTFVGVLVDSAQLAIGSVGDSRIYLLSRGTLEQLTVDDSWAATILAQDPTLKPEEIAQHPMRNVLTNVLGARETVNVHVTERTLASGDTLLLCSDGLHGVLAPATLQETLGRTNDFDTIPQTLVDLALTQGTRDNLTALVVRYEADR
jgi:protein phosphatase